MKENVDVWAKPIIDIYKLCIANRKFPDKLKLADISPIFEAVDGIANKNYMPVSNLNSISKVFEKIIPQKFQPFFDNRLSDHLCEYRKENYSICYTILNLIANGKKYHDNNDFSAAVLIDLSKAFDTINHGLLIAKLHDYGMEKESHMFIMNYPRNRYQRTKFNGSFSSWEEVHTGIP